MIRRPNVTVLTMDSLAQDIAIRRIELLALVKEESSVVRIFTLSRLGDTNELWVPDVETEKEWNAALKWTCEHLEK